MADYKTKDIRNIALLDHGGEGKTTLVESMLFAAGITDRQGKVEDGTTVTDFEPEEIRRKFSISAACVFTSKPFSAMIPRWSIRRSKVCFCSCCKLLAQSWVPSARDL